MKDELEIKRPKNFNNWPTVWQSCFNDGVEACKAALPSETAKDQEIEKLKGDLRLAIAHDRQPYPTAEAYDLVCKANNKRIETIAAMQRQIDDWREAFDKIVSSYDMAMSQYKHSELSYGIATKALEKYPKA